MNKKVRELMQKHYLAILNSMKKYNKIINLLDEKYYLGLYQDTHPSIVYLGLNDNTGDTPTQDYSQFTDLWESLNIEENNRRPYPFWLFRLSILGVSF